MINNLSVGRALLVAEATSMDNQATNANTKVWVRDFGKKQIDLLRVSMEEDKESIELQPSPTRSESVLSQPQTA